MKPLIDGFVPHVHRAGESYEYLFEVTEAFYTTEQLERLPMIKELFKIEDLIIRYRLSTLSAEADQVRQKIELTETGYRELTGPDLTRSGTEAGAGNRAPGYRALTSMIPGFPANLSYEFSGGDFIQSLNTACSPYLTHPQGIFLHYKLIDVHSFQSVVDDITLDEPPGSVVVRPSEDIPVEHGVFHNHEPVRLYHRIDLLEGVRHAYFKVQTMGNVFRVPQQGMEMHTNYQITFHVPLEGETAGLVTSGEQQELGYTVQSGEPVTAVQRQISLKMQSETTRSGVNLKTV